MKAQKIITALAAGSILALAAGCTVAPKAEPVQEVEMQQPVVMKRAIPDNERIDTSEDDNAARLAALRAAEMEASRKQWRQGLNK